MVPEAMWDGWEAALVALAATPRLRASEEGHRARRLPSASRATRRLPRTRDLLHDLRAFRDLADADLAALLHEEMRECLRRYEERKQEAGALDFLDLLIKARDLVCDNADVCREFRERFRVILVDEFQDTDPLQAELLLLPRRRRRRQRCGRARSSSSAIPSSRSIASAAPTSAPIAALRDELGDSGATAVTLQTSFRSVPAIQHFVNAAFRDDMDGDRDALQADYVPLLPHRADIAGATGGRGAADRVSVRQEHVRAAAGDADRAQRSAARRGRRVRAWMLSPECTLDGRRAERERRKIVASDVCLLVPPLPALRQRHHARLRRGARSARHSAPAGRRQDLPRARRSGCGSDRADRDRVARRRAVGLCHAARTAVRDRRRGAARVSLAARARFILTACPRALPDRLQPVAQGARHASRAARGAGTIGRSPTRSAG